MAKLCWEKEGKSRRPQKGFPTSCFTVKPTGRGQSSPDPMLGVFKRPPTSVPVGRPPLCFGAAGEINPVPATQVTPAPPCASGLRPRYKTMARHKLAPVPARGESLTISSLFYHPYLSYQLPGAEATSNQLSSPQIHDPSD